MVQSAKIDPRIIHKDAMGHHTCRCITRLDDSDEALSLAISVVFEWLCIDTDIDVERDREEIIRYDGKYIEGVCKSVSKAGFSMSV